MQVLSHVHVHVHVLTSDLIPWKNWYATRARATQIAGMISWSTGGGRSLPFFPFLGAMVG
jgi:hypothetical protein